MSGKRVLVYGGRGALGSVCVSEFKKAGYWVCSVDFSLNEAADCTVQVSAVPTLEEQSSLVLTKSIDALGGQKVDGIFCVAGGWAGGNASDPDFIKNCELTWKQSVWTSCIATALAAKCLKPSGILVLTGAKPALEGTAGMIGYGMAKAAVHQMTKSLACQGNGLPEGSTAVSILPITLDTPMNRKFMPQADFSTWTPLTEVASCFLKWLNKENLPSSGSLLQVITKNNITQFINTE